MPLSNKGLRGPSWAYWRAAKLTEKQSVTLDLTSEHEPLAYKTVESIQMCFDFNSLN